MKLSKRQNNRNQKALRFTLPLYMAKDIKRKKEVRHAGDQSLEKQRNITNHPVPLKQRKNLDFRKQGQHPGWKASGRRDLGRFVCNPASEKAGWHTERSSFICQKPVQKQNENLRSTKPQIKRKIQLGSRTRNIWKCGCTVIYTQDKGWAITQLANAKYA